MKKIIQTLLNGYDYPVLLSDAFQGEILYTNSVVEEELDISKQNIIGTQLGDLLKSDTIIGPQPVLELKDRIYKVRNEPFTVSDTKYIKSVLTPFPDHATFSYLTLQKEMASRMVHRLRSPLTGVSGFTELLKETSLDSQQLKYVKAIEEGHDDVKKVLSRLKVLGEDVPVQMEALDMHLFAEQVVGAYDDPRTRRIRLDIDEDLQSPETDPVLLKSIIAEIMDNAFQHGSGEGAIYLHFKRDRIRIHNEGPPIPPDLAPRIFYPFFSDKARNIGIGLAKCAYYAHALGLEIKLTENSEDAGVSFDIMFQPEAT